jgi:regulator of protease activity HflC (stomatin/prohibitin superfamily)
MRKKNERMIEGLEDARLMVKLSIVAGVGSIIMGLVVIFAGTATGWAGSDVFDLALLPCWMTLLFSIASTICGVMSATAARETEDKALLEKRKESVAAFNVDEDVRFTAGKSLDNYLKFAPYVLAIFGAILTLIMLVSYNYSWGKRIDDPIPSNALQGAVVAGVMMLVSLFGGAFYIGQSRDKAFRWLRPVGAWMVMNFMVMLLAAFAILMFGNGYPKTDLYISRILFWIFAVLGAEFIINFIVEFYRPRTIEEPRPIFESRLLALFTEPGGVMRNIADTLDYQFGFKVSSTWIYSFIERGLFPLLIIWVVVLWVFSGIAEVGPNQVGVRERFGTIVDKGTLLEPGIYYNMPWPFGRIARFSCEEIYSVTIGPLEDEEQHEDEEEEDDGHGHAKKPKKKHNEKESETVLWTEAHFHSSKGMFLVASKSESGGKAGSSSSLSYLGAMVDVQYHIRKKDLIQYAYKNKDSQGMLKRIGRKVLTKYFASESMIEIMSSKREKVGPALKKLIQKGANQEGLGVEVVAVILLDAHPPIKDVAPAYQKVIGARQKKESMIYSAEAYKAKILPAARATQQKMMQEATSYRYDKIKVAEAESERFQQQLIGYEQMPHALYKLRTYLSFLEKDCADIRKYILSANTPYQIYEINLEEKPRLDLIDTDLGEITN